MMIFSLPSFSQRLLGKVLPMSLESKTVCPSGLMNSQVRLLA